MAITHIGGATAFGSVPINTSGALDTTGATLLVIAIDWFTYGVYNNYPTDNYSNTWIPLTQQDSFAATSTRLFYALPSPSQVGIGHVFYTNTYGYEAIYVDAFSGTATSPFDQESVSATDSPGTLTPSADGALIIATANNYFVATNTSITIDGLNPWNFTATIDPSNYSGYAWFVQSTATAVTPTFTFDNPSFQSSAMAVFLPSGGGPTTNKASMFPFF